jgi:hypothetical protein
MVSGADAGFDGIQMIGKNIVHTVMGLG